MKDVGFTPCPDEGFLAAECFMTRSSVGTAVMLLRVELILMWAKTTEKKRQ